MRFYAGSKTFLVGEYNVLFGGDGIVLINEPNFSLTAAKSDKSSLTGIPPKSPGYKFYEAHKDVFRNFSINFEDPHKMRGGWGASSAQYSLLYKLFLRLTDSSFDVNHFLNEYQKLSKSGEVLPSGADCLAQFENHNICYRSKTRSYENLDLNFLNLGIHIFKTKNKVTTYRHLKTLDNLKTDNLQFFTEQTYNAIKNIDEAAFCDSVQEFFRELEKMNLVIPETSALVREILKLDGVKAAKGCGALSADTILVVYEKSKKDRVIESVPKQENKP